LLEEVTQHSDRLRAEFEEKLGRLPSAPDQAVPAFVSPTRICSSCGSTVLPDEEELGTYPVDEITYPTPCKLYVQDKILKNKVATGQAWLGNDVITHDHQLPIGYAKVTIDTIVKRSYGRTVDLDIPGQDGMKLLGENIGCIVAWRKCQLVWSRSDIFEVITLSSEVQISTRATQY